jgi:hypothetical protein
MRRETNTADALASGLAGAAALTLLHESARRIIPHAPRVDVIGMRGIRRPMQAMGMRPPRGRTLFGLSLLGEIASNAAYYALVGIGKPRHALRRGTALGLAAGVGCVLLPPVMGLGRQPHRRAPYTQLMTIAWYTVGGIAAALAATAMSRRK